MKRILTILILLSISTLSTAQTVKVRPQNNYLKSTEVVAAGETVATPKTGHTVIYQRDDGLWYQMDDAGVETPLIPESESDTIETLIFRHDLAGGLFTSLAEAENVNSGSASPTTENKYSVLSDLETFRSTDGIFRFRVVYPSLGEEIVWTQTNNPINDKALGQNSNIADNVVLVSSSSPDIIGDAVGSQFAGFNNSSSVSAYYDLSANTSNWWYPIGQTSFFGGSTMPVTQFSGASITSDLVELYVTKITSSGAETIVSSDTNNYITIGADGGAFLSSDSIKSFSPSAYSKNEIWLKIGQSNSVGTDGSGPIDYTGLDAVHPKVFEYSRGSDKSGIYRAAPAGELMAYRNPAQDDGSGIGFGQLFGKTRVALNPEINKLIIINRGVGGTGFNGNRWNPGDDLYTLAVNDLKQALFDFPDAVFKGIIWHQGESDAGQGQAFYEAALLAMVEGIRTEARNAAPGRSEGAFICGTMVESWIAANETARRPIDLAHRNVSSYIENATFADFSDLIENQDAIHFGTNDLREMGVRYALKAQDLVSTIMPSYRVKIINGEVVDLFNGGASVFDIITTTDPVRGEVLDSDNRGFQTSMVLNNTEYTKSSWVNLQTTVSGYGNFISGAQTGSGITNSHYWGWQGSGQNGSSTTATSTGLSNHISLNNWVHVSLTWDGSEHEVYVNGVSAATLPITSALSPPQLIELFTLGGNSSNMIDVLADDVVILPYALDATGALNLYNLVLAPYTSGSDISLNDQSISGYVDIGNTRIQWGEYSTTNTDDDETITFPVSFSNASYSVVITPTNGAAESSISDIFHVPSRTTSSFNINRDDNVDAFTTVLMWQAIGIKP